MRRTIVAALFFSVWLVAAEDATAQSALKRLADMIRSQQSADGAASPAAETDQPASEPADAASASSPNKDEPERGYLGLVVDDQKDRGRGVRILQVAPGGPAQKAGLKVGDLITSLGGVRVRQMDDLVAVLQQMLPGDSLDVEVLRGEARQKVQVTFARRPPVGAPRPSPESQPSTALPSLPDESRPGGRAVLDLIPRLLQPPGQPSPSLEAVIEQLQARIEELEHRVEKLERALESKH